MDRNRFKDLRNKIIIISCIIWAILLVNIRSHEEHWYSLDGAVFVLFTWWLPFVVGHYVAKSMARSEYETKEKEKANEQIKLTQEQEAEAARVYRQRTLSRYRILILDSLDSANNFIDLLSDPMYQDQKTMAKQKFAGELHAITAGVPLTDLTEIVRANEDIRIKVHQLNARLKDHSIEDANISIMLKAIQSGSYPVSAPR